ncbi:hypothetical protein AB3480_24790 [Rhizobium mongolense]|nr:hypothetical protein [Rhizobium mongolense]
MGKNVFAGSLLPFTSQATDALFDGLRQNVRQNECEEAAGHQG